MIKKKFVCFFWFVSWTAFSLGIHIDVSEPNLELHLPFGFIKIGWCNMTMIEKTRNAADLIWRIHGYRPKGYI